MGKGSGTRGADEWYLERIISLLEEISTKLGNRKDESKKKALLEEIPHNIRQNDEKADYTYTFSDDAVDLDPKKWRYYATDLDNKA